LIDSRGGKEQNLFALGRGEKEDSRASKMIMSFSFTSDQWPAKKGPPYLNAETVKKNRLSLSRNEERR